MKTNNVTQKQFDRLQKNHDEASADWRSAETTEERRRCKTLRDFWFGKIVRARVNK